MVKKYFIFIFAFAFLFLSFLPNIYEASVVNLLPPDRTMIWGEYNYTYDYNVYLSKIRQGQEGGSSVVDKYDNHPKQKGIFLVMVYLLAGKISSIFNSTPTLIYHLLRVFTSVFWISTIIFLNIYFLKKTSLVNLGVILSFLTAGFPVFYKFQDQLWIKSYMDWWQELDILKRISFIPHDSLNYIFISVFTILLGLVDKNKKYFILLCVLLFFSVFVQPSAAILFIISWCLYHLIKTIWSRGFPVKQTAVLFISIIIPLLYIKSVTSTYPWKTLMDFHENNILVFNIKDYVLALGPIFFTGVAGGILVIGKKKQELLGLVTWVIGVAVTMVLFKFFPYQSLRFVQTANHIPLAILSAYLFYELWKTARFYIKAIIVITVITIITNGLAQTYFSIKAQTQFINQRALATLPLVPYPPQVMYPLTDFYNGLKWLEKNTGRQTVVLAKITAGNYIPAYSGNFVYLGHIAETPNFDNRVKKADEFFSGNLTEEQAFKFLKTENIDYVFYGPQEKENAVKDISAYTFLKAGYQSPLVTIYEVKI
ncbi:MAG: hypothetical protein US40_C0011G0006 [Candidatus Roizmanbacteria bacterium GW2011_GWC2_37_13]|uniref:Glycosyltransferase RgtA/B/C/D-like domain-containing protein n=1 Tax=Candidatus Roizmanbacteria bacterium GW2011_GWC2_37_13 TaxID=1618486 RepID=A0A0G0JAA8_9BACT|nr:MAG: hypothetical protein US38_C0007G0006 [Candidatus Roizmanbacteria bacterium GW2011_GWC1_37_12]KKQ25121.1 MAG: hypothetical protein US40_C0011G0006 [Candidatus Roizmanbacteria bacterium GW2011_GWC2_37_13]